MNRELSISCIVPMHNEEDNAEGIINAAESIFSQIASDWEIIIIESGSGDNTREKINEMIGKRKNIYAYYQEKKEGMGSALRLGYSKCRKDLICHLEADSPFETIYFRKALPVLAENDCVIGYRVGPREEGFKWSYYNMGKMALLMRKLYHVGYNLLLRIVFGLVVRDINFSFKIFKRKDIQDLNLISNGWFIDAEILLELKRKGILPIEMPIEYKDRTGGRSTINLFTPIHMIYEMLRYIKAGKRMR